MLLSGKRPFHHADKATKMKMIEKDGSFGRGLTEREIVERKVLVKTVFSRAQLQQKQEKHQQQQQTAMSLCT